MTEAINAISRKNPFRSEDAYKLYASTASYSSNSMDHEDKQIAFRGLGLLKFNNILPDGANLITGGNAGNGLNGLITPQQQKHYEEFGVFDHNSFMIFA